MVISLVILRAGILGILACFLAGCVSASAGTESGQSGFGYKKIYIGSGGVKVLRTVLDDWEKIVKAIYRYQPRDCIKENLTIDSIASVGLYSGAEKVKYLSRANVTTDSGQVKVLSVGTDSPCVFDPNSSGPAWIIMHSDGEYKVLDDISISE